MIGRIIVQNGRIEAYESIMGRLIIYLISFFIIKSAAAHEILNRRRRGSFLSIKN